MIPLVSIYGLIGMKQSKLDPDLYSPKLENELKRIIASYVDDLLSAGKEKMKKTSLRTRETFELYDENRKPIEFTGVIIKENSKDRISVGQDLYITRNPVPMLYDTSTYNAFP